MSHNKITQKTIEKVDEKLNDKSLGGKIDQMSHGSNDDMSNEIMAILDEEGGLDEELDPDDPNNQGDKQSVTNTSTKRHSITSLTDLRGVSESKKKEIADLLEFKDIEYVKNLFQFKEKYSRPLTEQEQKLNRDI